MKVPPCFRSNVAAMSLVVMALISISTAQKSQAALLYYEGFDYSVGSLSSQNGGVGFDNAWGTAGSGGSVNVQSGSLSYGTLVASGGKAYLSPSGTGGATITRNLDSSLNTGTIYLSFLTNLDDGNRYFGLALDNSGGEIFLTGKPTTYGSPGAWSLSNSANIPGSPVSSGVSISLDTTVAMVLRIDFNASGVNERIRLYVNPTLGIEPATAAVDVVSSNSFSINQIRLTSGYFVAGSPTAYGWVDEIRLGTDYASVTPVPEPSTWMLGILGLFVILGRFRVRQRA